MNRTCPIQDKDTQAIGFPWWEIRDTDKKVTNPYLINCSPFSRAMVCPLSTENPTPGGLTSSRLAGSLSDIPNSLTIYITLNRVIVL